MATASFLDPLRKRLSPSRTHSKPNRVPSAPAVASPGESPASPVLQRRGLRCFLRDQLCYPNLVPPSRGARRRSPDPRRSYQRHALLQRRSIPTLPAATALFSLRHPIATLTPAGWCRFRQRSFVRVHLYPYPWTTPPRSPAVYRK